MSTLASPSPVPAARRKAAPVTAHPWFPAIAALWLAALLGLSSLVLAPAMLERLVAASGIASFVPAAAPPLGQTARLLVALGLAGVGAVVGMVLARIVGARSRAAMRGKQRNQVPSTELPDAEGSVEEAGETRTGLRERLAQLTGKSDGPRDFDDLPKLRARDRHPDAPGRKPLSPSQDLAAHVEGHGTVMASEVAEIASPAPEEPERPSDARPSQAGYVPPPFSALALLPEKEWTPPGPFTEPVAEFAGPSDQAVAVTTTEEATQLGETEPLDLDRVVTAETPLLHCAPTEAQAAIAAAPLAELGVVQLTERLALAMQARRERDARRAAARMQATPAEQGPLAQPALVAIAPGSVLPTAPDRATLDSDKLETGYSSLLGLSRKPAETEPTSALPLPNPTPFAVPSAAALRTANAAARPAPGDSAETYRALKSALDSIQRISGTG